MTQGKRETPGKRETKAERARREAAEAELTRQARKAAKRGRARMRAAYNAELTRDIDAVALAEATARLAEAKAAPRSRRARGPAPHAAPGTYEERWVPIGPSVVLQGQAVDRPRVSGRITDVWCDDTGTRAYAASAMGGVWYTANGGATWDPFGGWAMFDRVAGGSSNGLSMGCLLVAFGASQAQDIVLAGTGELIPSENETANQNGGIGVLAAFNRALSEPAPWEAETGLAQFEGLGIFRLVRRPAAGGAIGGSGAAEPDVVLACTSRGAFIGIRSSIPAAGAVAVHDAYAWRKLDLGPLSNATITDATWPVAGRVILAIDSLGPHACDVELPGGRLRDLRLKAPVAIQNPAAVTVLCNGRQTLAAIPGDPKRVYLLGEDRTTGAPAVWRTPDATATPVVLTKVGGTPPSLWGTGLSSQRDYDQAIAVDEVGPVAGPKTERVYLGGSFFNYPQGGGASLYSFTYQAAPPMLLPTPGTIGQNVHADIHMIRLKGTLDRPRQVWVACDGGVFVSQSDGRPFTFSSANTGIAALQPTFARTHPVNGHFVVSGFQDNGTQSRVGDTVWVESAVADGGGVAFAPLDPSILVYQYVQAAWQSIPAAPFVDPVTRTVGGTWQFPVGDPDDAGALFYSAAAAVHDKPAMGPEVGRLAFATFRIWVTDNLGRRTLLGVPIPPTWVTLPWPANPPPAALPAQDTRNGLGVLVPNANTVGQPPAIFGTPVTLAWASPTQLLTVFNVALSLHTDTGGGNWSVKTWYLPNASVPINRNSRPTDVAPVPGRPGDFYVSTLGIQGRPIETLWWHSATLEAKAGETASGFRATNLRHQLDQGATLGPRDPAFAVVVDPADPKVVYVGTATGVWRGTRTNDQGLHHWDRLDNGLPQAMVQDLHIWWEKPGDVTSLRLLRAGVMSRGLWELDLSQSTSSATAPPGRTWIRARAWDNRRVPLAQSFDPTTRLATASTPCDSPDIVVRPAWPRSTAPAFPAAAAIPPGTTNPYAVWTFQTAFRWLFPSVVADGVFSTTLATHIMTQRGNANATIDRTLWDSVMQTKIDATGNVSAAGQLAVYRAPWHTPRAMSVPPTEADFLQLVVPPKLNGSEWQVFREPSTIDVLIHHRDAAPLNPHEAYAVLLWHEFSNGVAHASVPAAPVIAYLRGVASGVSSSTPPPAGWNVVRTPIGDVMHQLDVSLDARLPRGVSIDVDLSPARLTPTTNHVLFLAFVNNLGETTLADPAVAAPANLVDMVTSWTYTAARQVHLMNRP